jgi:AraC-like DNA-binding protein
MVFDGNLFLVLSIIDANQSLLLGPTIRFFDIRVVAWLSFLIAYNSATSLIFSALMSVIASWMLFTAIQKRRPLLQGLRSRSNSRACLRPAIRPEIADIYLINLADLMDRERLFLDGNLTLPVVAKNLGISPHLISETLNGRLGQSFVEYINSRRIAEVQRLLLDPRFRHKSIMALAFEAGFNSKTAFNRVFKQSVGITPSEFRRQAVNTAKDQSAAKKESLAVRAG